MLLVTQRDRHPKQALGRRRGKGEKACAGKAAGTVSEQRGLEAPPGQPHGGTCDFAGAVVLSGTKKKDVFFVNTIAISSNEGYYY